MIQSTKRARSGRKRERALRPGLRSRLSRDGQSANSEKLYKRISSISSWEPEEKLTQLAVSLNPRLPPERHLAFPLLFVRAAGDEGDTVLLGHPTILPGARDREDRITWSCATIRLVSSLLRAASPTIFLRGGGSERESRDRGIGNLLGDFESPWTEVTGVWVLGGRRLHNSDKKFALTMGADAEA